MVTAHVLGETENNWSNQLNSERKQMPRFFILLTLLLVVSGCSKDSHEQVARDYLDVMTKFVSKCETISDPKAAKESKEEIGELLSELKLLKTRSKELGIADKNTQNAIEKKYEKEFTSLSENYTKAVSKIEQNPDVVEELKSELKTLANLVNARPIRPRR